MFDQFKPPWTPKPSSFFLAGLVPKIPMMVCKKRCLGVLHGQNCSLFPAEYDTNQSRDFYHQSQQSLMSCKNRTSQLVRSGLKLKLLTHRRRNQGIWAESPHWPRLFSMTHLKTPTPSRIFPGMHGWFNIHKSMWYSRVIDEKIKTMWLSP